MAATVEFDFVGAGATIGSGVSAESGFKFGLDDLLTCTTPIPIPASAGQNFSYYKEFCFNVTGAFASTISNFTIKMNTSPTTGLRLWWKAVAQASYVQASGSNNPADDASSHSNTPAGYTAVTTSPQTWAAAGVSAGTTGLKGDMLYLLLGVGDDYTGGGNSALALPAMTATYDEA